MLALRRHIFRYRVREFFDNRYSVFINGAFVPLLDIIKTVFFNTRLALLALNDEEIVIVRVLPIHICFATAKRTTLLWF